MAHTEVVSDAVSEPDAWRRAFSSASAAAAAILAALGMATQRQYRAIAQKSAAKAKTREESRRTAKGVELTKSANCSGRLLRASDMASSSSRVTLSP